jgi:RNA polymerase sigma-70 factor (family 1)
MSISYSQDLVLRFNRRDSAAIARVYDEYYPLVYSIAKKLTSGSADTKDLASDSFVKLLQYKGEFESIIKIKFFLYIATKNTCLDYIKHRQIQHTRAFEIKNYWALTEENALEASEIAADLRRRIHGAVEKLPHQCKQIFLLYYLTGLNNSEIATELGISEKTVSNQKSISKKILKMMLSKLKNIYP